MSVGVATDQKQTNITRLWLVKLDLAKFQS